MLEEDSDYALSDALLSRMMIVRGNILSSNIKFLTVDWLVKRHLDTFRADLGWSLLDIIHRMRSDLYMEISTQKAWNVK
jgi:hypothetical protein